MNQRERMLQAILATRKSDANLSDLAAAFLDAFGNSEGVSGVMKEVKLVYDASVTSADKTKILIAGIDLIKQVAAQNKGAPEDPFAAYSDDDLRRHIRVALGDSDGNAEAQPAV